MTLEEKHSAVWMKLKEVLNEQLELLRRQNDTDKSETETAFLRGRITEIKNILSLEED